MKTVSHIKLDSSGIVKNDEILHALPSGNFKDIARGVYQLLEMSYPKYFKMDTICKLALAAAEVLIKDSVSLEDMAGSDVGILLATRSGCLESDQKHMDSIANPNQFFPSPAVFVYTLPNIMLGEICIKFNIKGESDCFMMDSFDKNFMNTYVSDLLNRENYRYCIAGWIDYSKDDCLADLTLFSSSQQNK